MDNDEQLQRIKKYAKEHFGEDSKQEVNAAINAIFGGDVNSVESMTAMVAKEKKIVREIFRPRLEKAIEESADLYQTVSDQSEKMVFIACISSMFLQNGMDGIELVNGKSDKAYNVVIDAVNRYFEKEENAPKPKESAKEDRPGLQIDSDDIAEMVKRSDWPEQDKTDLLAVLTNEDKDFQGFLEANNHRKFADRLAYLSERTIKTQQEEIRAIIVPHLKNALKEIREEAKEKFNPIYATAHSFALTHQAIDMVIAYGENIFSEEDLLRIFSKRVETSYMEGRVKKRIHGTIE